MATAADTRTIPYDWYVDPAVLRVEQERIFADAWQYAGPLAKVSEPGSVVAVQAGHVPVILTRGRDDELRGFVNVCRHRGAVLCEGEERRETIQCPYHAWTYDLDGSLRTAPRADREIGFDRDELALVPVAVETWGPFVFVNPDADCGAARRASRRAAAACSPRAASTSTRSSSRFARRATRTTRTGR